MYIQNVGYHDILEGTHRHTEDDILIQILDPYMEFPTPKYKFKEIHQFTFSDVPYGSIDEVPEKYRQMWENRITEKQAHDIVTIIKESHKKGLNIIVQCFAGSCRSGAVVEVAIMCGYTDLKEYRKPNAYVEQMLIFAILEDFNDDAKKRYQTKC